MILEVVTGSFARIRAEAENAAVVEEKNGKRSATFNIAEFEETRDASSKTQASQHPKEQHIFSKKTQTCNSPAGVAHYEDSVWGADVNVFNPERFLPSSKGSTEDERKRKAAYIPFGGGRHLCPGRNLALAEIIGFASALLLGFEIEAVGMGFGNVKMLGPQLAGGDVKA
ncbi:Cytochrome P450, E-class, group IV [Fusarium oxysporum f. sp. vasinfectum]|nr:Cytochrome P450, E-class, group IV [Fusarium oxysporum f. sp. vasinfectum]KAK2667748.1 Cytochrome P450, E-class, group IV [Fusarium oxysporum f. sp. vasinfectum]